MRSSRLLISALLGVFLLAGGARANGAKGGMTWTAGTVLDASGANTTSPCKTGTIAPATCAVGECFFDTDATVGQNTYGCTSTNTWTLQGDGTGAGALPAGMMAPFNAACPTGWTEVVALQGRLLVGVPSGGTLAGTVGTALTNLQDPTHLHGTGTLASSAPTFTGSALSGGTRKGGTTNPASIIENGAVPAGTVSAPAISGSTAAVSSTMPYIQYRWCSKD